MDRARGVARFYDGWQHYNRYLTDGIRSLTPEQLAIRPGPDAMPIWATVAHTAGPRVYWLCHVLGEPGADTPPFVDADGMGWEDDESTPRAADELVMALDTSWAVVEGCLERWTPDMLDERFAREYAGRTSIHTRQSVLMRLIAHDAYHCGQLSQTLGAHGLPQIDLWPPQASPGVPS